MAQEYSQKAIKFIFSGVNLTNPVDLIPPFQYAKATNIRSYTFGVITSRPGLTLIEQAGTEIHSLKRLNDPIANSFSRIRGSGTTLRAGQTSSTQIDSGYSGNPLSFIIMPPVLTPRPYIYISDSSKKSKFKVGASATVDWGINAPNKSPFISFGVPSYTIISDMESSTGWAAGGTAGSISNPDRVNTTIARIAYDVGSVGWASIEPTATTEINEGMFLIFNASETAIVDEVIPGIPTTTIAAISYDSGTSGDCSIQLTASVGKMHLKKGSLISISTENVVVRDVVYGPDGVPSIRTTTSATRSVGDTVIGRSAFRVYLVGTFAATNTLTSKMIQSTIGTGIGYVTLTAAVDASKAGNRPIDMEEDEVHISIKISDLSKLTEAKIYLDVDASTNTFLLNYYFKALEPNDFVLVTKDLATVYEQRLIRLQKKLAKAIQKGNFEKAEKLREKIAKQQANLNEADKTPIEDQTTLGDNQWTELRFKTKDLFRVGSDLSRNLKNVAAIRIQVNCTASLTLDVDAFWIGGTYGPDIGDLGKEYIYMFRYRNKETGVISAWSPPNRSGLKSHRQRNSVLTTASADSQVDIIDVARKGGVLQGWKIIGTTTNGGVFNDDLSDSDAERLTGVDLDSFQPFVLVSTPVTGVATISGTTVDLTSGTIDLNLIRNNQILINNQIFTLYGPPLSTTKFEINENGGLGSGLALYIPQPTLANQKLRSVFGPIGYGETGLFIFGCGSSQNPGTLFWSNGNNPELMRDTNNLDICSGSEILIAGCVYNGKAFVISTEKLYYIYPSFSSDSMFSVEEIPNSKGMLGLLQNDAITVGPEIYYRGKDGIYATNGGVPRNITNKLLYNLFPHDGQAGVTTNGYNPPDDSKAQHLEYGDGFLLYDYIDTSNNPITLVLNIETNEVTPSFDTYNSNIVPLVHCYEEGDNVHNWLVGGRTSSTTGKLWSQSGTSDDGNAIAITLETFAFDAEVIRNRKVFGDIFFDSNPKSATVNIVITFDRNTATESSESNQTRSAATRTKTPPLDIQNGDGKLAYTESLQINWSSTTVAPELFAWVSTFIIKPPDITILATDPDDLGTPHAKFVQGFRIHCNTFNVAKTFKVQSDTGTNGVWADQQSFTITSNGQSVQAFSFDNAFITHLIRIVSADSDAWELFQYQFEFNIEPELVEEWEGQQTSHGLNGYQHAKGLQIAHLSTANLSLIRILDGVSQSAITIPHSGGLRKKTYVEIPAIKYKVCQYKITSSSGFRLYLGDSEIRVKQWNSDSDYQTIRALGDLHYDKGITI